MDKVLASMFFPEKGFHEFGTFLLIKPPLYLCFFGWKGLWSPVFYGTRFSSAPKISFRSCSSTAHRSTHEANGSTVTYRLASGRYLLPRYWKARSVPGSRHGLCNRSIILPGCGPGCDLVVPDNEYGAHRHLFLVKCFLGLAQRLAHIIFISVHSD